MVRLIPTHHGVQVQGTGSKAERERRLREGRCMIAGVMEWEEVMTIPQRETPKKRDLLGCR